MSSFIEKRKNIIRQRILNIIEKEDTTNAIKRVSGYLEGYFWDQWVLNQLGSLYYNSGNKVRAGRLWYFKESKTIEELHCVELYKKSKGHDKIQILREQIGNNYKSPLNLKKSIKMEFLRLIEEIEMENDFIPKFSKNWYHHFIKIRNDKNITQIK